MQTKTSFQTQKSRLLIWISLLLIPILAAGMLTSCSSKDNAAAEGDKSIVLFTDFGAADYRVPQVKGIIYNANPGVRLIDGTHSVPAFDIPTGAFILEIAAKEFPENMIFVAIIAPYTQPETRYLVLTTNNNRIFVLPDNGLLTYVAKNLGTKTLYQINNQQLFDKPIKELAAERIQGKIGALLAAGYRTQDVGSVLSNPKTLDIQEPVIAGNKLLGTIVYIDNYGNCITNVSAKTISEFGVKPGDSIQVKSPQQTLDAKLGTIYSDVPQGKEVVFVNNNLGMLQLSINLGNFAGKYSMKAGMKVEIEK